MRTRTCTRTRTRTSTHSNHQHTPPTRPPQPCDPWQALLLCLPPSLSLSSLLALPPVHSCFLCRVLLLRWPVWAASAVPLTPLRPPSPPVLRYDSLHMRGSSTPHSPRPLAPAPTHSALRCRHAHPPCPRPCPRPCPPPPLPATCSSSLLVTAPSALRWTSAPPPSLL